MSWVLIATPGYGGWRNMPTVQSMHRSFNQVTDIKTAHHIYETSSLLANSFNRAWAVALNRRQSDGKDGYFLLLHSDIEAKQQDWFPTLFGELRSHNADVMSVIVPIKDMRGLTSTARDTDHWRPRRYTLKELQTMPNTFTAPDLLVNTGMMLVDLRGDWVEHAHFTIQDTIRKIDGVWEAEVAPEDWNFSRMARSAGATLYATKAVVVNHIGEARYANDGVWGQDDDQANIEAMEK